MDAAAAFHQALAAEAHISGGGDTHSTSDATANTSNTKRDVAQTQTRTAPIATASVAPPTSTSLLLQISRRPQSHLQLQLPTEVWGVVFGFLPADALSDIACVCKMWSHFPSIGRNGWLWHELCVHKWVRQYMFRDLFFLEHSVSRVSSHSTSVRPPPSQFSIIATAARLAADSKQPPTADTDSDNDNNNDAAALNPGEDPPFGRHLLLTLLTGRAPNAVLDRRPQHIRTAVATAAAVTPTSVTANAIARPLLRRRVSSSQQQPSPPNDAFTSSGAAAAISTTDRFISSDEEGRRWVRLLHLSPSMPLRLGFRELYHFFTWRWPSQWDTRPQMLQIVPALFREEPPDADAAAGIDSAEAAANALLRRQRYTHCFVLRPSQRLNALPFESTPPLSLRVAYAGLTVGGDRTVRANHPFPRLMPSGTTPPFTVIHARSSASATSSASDSANGLLQYDIRLSMIAYFEITIGGKETASAEQRTLAALPDTKSDVEIPATPTAGDGIGYQALPSASPTHAHAFTPPPSAQSECITIGLCQSAFPPVRRQPGWDTLSYGWHGDDGRCFHGGGRSSVSYGRKFGRGDTVGCLLDYASNTIGFTLNGQWLGVAFTDVQTRGDVGACYYPVVGIDSSSAVEVEINFGFTAPFVFDLEHASRGVKLPPSVIGAAAVDHKSRNDAALSRPSRDSKIPTTATATRAVAVSLPSPYDLASQSAVHLLSGANGPRTRRRDEPDSHRNDNDVSVAGDDLPMLAVDPNDVLLVTAERLHRAIHRRRIFAGVLILMVICLIIGLLVWGVPQ